MSTQQLVKELKAMTNIYVAISNAECELAALKTEHKNSPLSPHHLQQRVASIGRNLEERLERHKNNFSAGSEQQRLCEALPKSVQSFQRYAVNNIPMDQNTTTTPTVSMGMSR